MVQELGITTYWNADRIPATVNIDKTGDCPISGTPLNNGEPVAVHDPVPGSNVSHAFHLSDLRTWFRHIDAHQPAAGSIEPLLPYNCPQCQRPVNTFGLDQPLVKPTSIKVRNFCMKALASTVVVGAVLVGAAVAFTKPGSDLRNNLITSRVVTGFLAGLAAGSGISCLAAAYVDYEENHKARALLKTALGVTCLALAYYAWQNIPEVPEHVCSIDSPTCSLKDPSSSYTSSCPIDQVRQILEEGQKTAGGATCISRYFDELAKTDEGFSCDNFLPWPTIPVDPIMEQIRLPLVWGISPDNIPFIFTSYHCPDRFLPDRFLPDGFLPDGFHSGGIPRDEFFADFPRVSPISQIPGLTSQNMRDIGFFHGRCFFPPESICDPKNFTHITNLFHQRELLPGTESWKAFVAHYYQGNASVFSELLTKLQPHSLFLDRPGIDECHWTPSRPLLDKFEEAERAFFSYFK